ncbi:MAG: UbiH/UbiF family hydroxylase [Pseudolabrys sp.]|nr:UbiH/UbiF family hydroxylase [Pseudolabrys sp.]
MTDSKRPIAVIGGGPAGLTAAIALASAEVPTILIGKRSPRPDNRTTALLSGSVAALEALGVWSRCVKDAAPLRTMRIVDDTGRLMRAPEARFEATEIGLDAFGYNIENRHLLDALYARAAQLPSLQFVDALVSSVVPDKDAVTLKTDGRERIIAALVVGADGRQSVCREAAGIAADERRYPQSALTLSFTHARPHNDISTEFHTPSGPFTQVPLPGNRSSLVWVLDPDDAAEMSALDDEALSAAVERGLHSILGKVTVETSKGLFPLTSITTKRFADNRIALVGEAAHVLPPIGAQGLNLGLRDAATIAELAVQAVRQGVDPGAPDVLNRYDDLRRADVGSRSLAVDLLNRSLLSDFLPAQATRGAGLYLLNRIGPLRRAAMREGTAPRVQPKLMCGEPI